jgi:hypothetical protein
LSAENARLKSGFLILRLFRARSSAENAMAKLYALFVESSFQ